MIKLENSTPQIFYKHSRDFQFIGRLFDVMLNDVKTSSDSIYYLPLGINTDDQLVNLLATSLGFKATHSYNSKQLGALCSVLPEVLRNKGSLQAVTIAANAILYSEGLTENIEYRINDGEFIIFVPAQLSDLTLLTDILTYILPAGISCSIVKELKETYQVKTEISIENKVHIYRTNTETDYIYTDMSDTYDGAHAVLAPAGTALNLLNIEIADIVGPFANSELYNVLTTKENTK